LEQREVPAVFLVGDTADTSGLLPTGGTGTAANPFQIGSLRSAIERANLTPGIADVIRFDATLLNQTITLDTSNAPLTFAAGAKTTIDGQTRNVTVDGGGTTRLQRVFTVNTGASAGISNITIQNGIDNLPSGVEPLGGGGIRNAGTMALTGVTLTGNVSRNNSIGGGAIFNALGARAALTRCEILNNQAQSPLSTDFVPGGGIANQGTLTIIDTTIRSNTASSNGAGIENRGVLAVRNSTISNNTHSAQFGASGGGIFNAGVMSLTNATISRNQAAFAGGGIFNANTGSAALLNCTITENMALAGGGIRVQAPNAGKTFRMRNTIVSGNDNSSESDDDLSGDPESPRAPGDVPVFASYCLIGTMSNVVVIGIGNQFNVNNPMLGNLQDNGGPTFTHEPLSGSPAINTGDPNGFGLPVFDQRGPLFFRVRGGRVDIGAVEVQAGSFPAIASLFFRPGRDRRYH
jgi:hypothetical protein